MPLTSIGSYLTTMDEFLAHWSQVNVELGGTPETQMKLKGGHTLADFTADQAALQAAITALPDLENDRQLAAADRDAEKANLRERLRQFRAAVSNELDETPYERALPKLVELGSAETKFLAAFDDMASLWAKINADTTTPGFTAPLTLAGAYALAGFTVDLAGLRTGFKTVTNTESDARLARERRDQQLDDVRERLNQYRSAVEANFTPGDPLLETLPALSPTSGGSSGGPDAVVAEGQWDDVALQAQISWSASSDPDLDLYQLRTAPGPSYDELNETLVEILPADVTNAATAEGLGNPGDSALFRVYVVLTNGDESGSNVVSVTRT